MAGLWWLYFSRFDESVFDRSLEGGMPERRRSFVYGYGHLPVFASFAAVGAGLRLDIESALRHGAGADSKPLLAVAVLCSLVSLSIVQRARNE